MKNIIRKSSTFMQFQTSENNFMLIGADFIPDVNGNIWKPIRIALSGQEHGPDISKFAEIIGSNECTNRLSLFLKSNVH